MPSTTYTGQVIISHGEICSVESANLDLQPCFNRRKLGHVVCGDWVTWQRQDDESGVIQSIKPRKTQLSRLDRKGKCKAIAANFDHMVITLALLPTPDLFLIDSYIAFAHQYNIKCSLIINKIDLIDAQTQQTINRLTKTYGKLGCQVETVSIKQAKNTDTLTHLLKDQTSILVGQSGVGKSSIIDFLLPDSQARIGELSGLSGLGSHTTTTTILYHLAGGGDLIDSPGVRQFIPAYPSEQTAATAFKEFNDYQGQCKFNNCKHLNEPGCAIIDAVEQGDIEQSRYMSYRILTETSEPKHKK